MSGNLSIFIDDWSGFDGKFTSNLSIMDGFVANFGCDVLCFVETVANRFT